MMNSASNGQSANFPNNIDFEIHTLAVKISVSAVKKLRTDILISRETRDTVV